MPTSEKQYQGQNVKAPANIIMLYQYCSPCGNGKYGLVLLMEAIIEQEWDGYFIRPPLKRRVEALAEYYEQVAQIAKAHGYYLDDGMGKQGHCQEAWEIDEFLKGRNE